MNCYNESKTVSWIAERICVIRSHNSLASDQWILVSRSRRHNAMNFMEVVGPPGLEPSTKGL
jgi:hypothetical protein